MNRIIKNGLTFPLMFILVVSIIFNVQYSNAESIIQVSKFPTGPEIGTEEELTVKDEEEPTVKDEGDQSVEDERQPTVKGEEGIINEESNETKSEALTGKFGSNLVDKNFSQLAEANVTRPNYTITIKFDTLTPFGPDPAAAGIYEWNIAAYVQGEKNVLKFPTTSSNFGTISYKFYSENYRKPIPLKNPPVTIEIPAEPVESIYDSMPLSIFTVGTYKGNPPCSTLYIPPSWPTELPEVKEALADKGSTRPYYAHTMEKITQIQQETNTGCINVVPRSGGYDQVNMKLKGTLNVLERSPNYGKRVPADTVGNPESVQVTTCTHPFLYCLTYTITCPLCLTQRVH